VIVQRRAWTVTEGEPEAEISRASRAIWFCGRHARCRNLPRFASPSGDRRCVAGPKAATRIQAGVDLSYLFLEIFHRWLTKAGELEVTEMLPDPDHLPWKEADGRRTFELRTLIVPGA
jgi:hypothetical protein